MKWPMRLFALAGALLVLAACDDAPSAGGLAPLPQLATVPVQLASGGNRTWDGVVEAVRHADLAAQTTGRVTTVAVDVNDRVAQGDVLLRITAVEQYAGADAARAQLRAAQAAAVEAEGNYRRFESLGSAQYVSRAQIDQARAARDSAVAARDAASAALAQAGQQAGYTVVRAPFAGIVSARHVEPGESIAPGQPLLSVYAPGALRIEVQVPQSEAAAIRAASQAGVVLGDGRRIEAAQVMVFPVADPATHSVGVRIVLPDMKDPPRPGATAKVVFPIGGGQRVLQIPYSALAQRGEVSGVYVLADNRLELRQLRLGRRLGDEVEVLAGLKQGERIASDPVAAVQALAAQREAARE